MLFLAIEYRIVLLHKCRAGHSAEPRGVLHTKPTAMKGNRSVEEPPGTQCKDAVDGESRSTERIEEGKHVFSLLLNNSDSFSLLKVS